jgi:hypothetical protein
MKKIIGLLAFLAISSSCDDGDLTVEAISFDDVTAQKCGINDIIYKVKSNEALLIEIGQDGATPFANDVTTSPREFAIGSDNNVVYRSYSGPIGVGNICATIPATTPIVVNEWVAVSGTIQITTTAITAPNTSINSPNATRITDYNHYIVLKNVTFIKPSGTQLYETFVFGNYRTDATTLPIAFDDQVEKCAASNLVYNWSGSEALLLDIDPSFFQNTPGTQIGEISATNKVIYKLFESGLTSYDFCANPIPTSPAVREEWIAKDGVTNVSGIIEVTTTTFGTGFQHTIRLKKVTFKKGNSEFYLGDDYLYGSFIQ